MLSASGSPESCISTAAIMCSRTLNRVSRAVTWMAGGTASGLVVDAWEQAAAIPSATATVRKRGPRGDTSCAVDYDFLILTVKG